MSPATAAAAAVTACITDVRGLELLSWNDAVRMEGRERTDFVLNRPDFAGVSILVGGSTFGCGSSREHAVWGPQQFGIRAVVGCSFAEVFYSNAKKDRLLLITLPPQEIAALMNDADDLTTNGVSIDVTAQALRRRSINASFDLLPRHRLMASITPTASPAIHCTEGTQR